jgi:DNA-directed RNA polymerase sigma subunit (sigma70/sigma32)
MENGRPATTEELSEILDLNERTVKRVSEISAEGRVVLPLDGPRRGRNESLLSQLRDEGAENPLEKLEMEEATAELREALTLSMQERLTTEEVVALGMRYGLYQADKATYREIADVLGVSSENAVRRKISNGIAKLRRSVKADCSASDIDYSSEDGLVDPALLARQLNQIAWESKQVFSSAS